MLSTHLTDGVDVDVVLGVLGMRHERLNEEVPQHTLDSLHLLNLAGALLNPRSRLGPGSIQLEQTGLSSPLDEHVWLCDELGIFLEEEREGGLGLVEDTLDILAFREVDGRESGGGVVRFWCCEGSGLDDGGASEVVVEDGLAVGLEDGLGGHVEGCSVVLSSGELVA